MTTDELSKLTQRMVDAVGELTGPGGTVALVAYASEADLLRFQPDWAGTLQEHRQVLNAVALTGPPTGAAPPGLGRDASWVTHPLGRGKFRL